MSIHNIRCTTRKHTYLALYSSQLILIVFPLLSVCPICLFSLMIQNALRKLSLSWTYNNFKMTFHYHTGVLITTSPSAYLNLSSYVIATNSIQNIPLMEVPFLTSICKDLGIRFSYNLTWRLHYQNVISKAYKSYSLLCMLHIQRQLLS